MVQVGPFFYANDVENEIDHRGVARKITYDVALAQTSTVQLELIAIKETSGSAYADALGLGGTGFHHLGTWAADYEATLERYTSSGAEIAHSGITVGGCRYSYLDTRDTHGAMIELVEPVSELLAVFKGIADAAERRALLAYLRIRCGRIPRWRPRPQSTSGVSFNSPVGRCTS